MNNKLLMRGMWVLCCIAYLGDPDPETGDFEDIYDVEMGQITDVDNTVTGWTFYRVGDIWYEADELRLLV